MGEDDLLDISHWNIQAFYNILGSRDKYIVENDHGIIYYFKKSKEESGFIHEFWSEIIAYRLGVMLNLPVLRYDVAILDEHIGCISQSMSGVDEELIEGLRLLQAYDPSFVVAKRKGQEKYTYQLIEKTLTWLGWSMHMYKMLQTIVFDAIIGNQDRHQENWGFVIKLNRNSPHVREFADIIMLNQKGYFTGKEGFSEYAANRYITYSVSERFAPIYDNGSSLGRELSESTIKLMLKDQALIRNYIKRGKSEIRWLGERTSHFNILLNLNRESGYTWYDDILHQTISRFNPVQLYAILESVDQDVPTAFGKYKLSPERKELILQLVTLRIEYLKTLLEIRY